jgi:hypothetical protein
MNLLHLDWCTLGKQQPTSQTPDRHADCRAPRAANYAAHYRPDAFEYKLTHYNPSAL